jgi:hypothetical protein
VDGHWTTRSRTNFNSLHPYAEKEQSLYTQCLEALVSEFRSDESGRSGRIGRTLPDKVVESHWLRAFDHEVRRSAVSIGWMRSRFSKTLKRTRSSLSNRRIGARHGSEESGRLFWIPTRIVGSRLAQVAPHDSKPDHPRPRDRMHYHSQHQADGASETQRCERETDRRCSFCAAAVLCVAIPRTVAECGPSARRPRV